MCYICSLHFSWFQKPSWEKAAKTIRERFGAKLDISFISGTAFIILLLFCRYDPDVDGRILMARVDCTIEGDLCRRYVS